MGEAREEGMDMEREKDQRNQGIQVFGLCNVEEREAKGAGKR